MNNAESCCTAEAGAKWGSAEKSTVSGKGASGRGMDGSLKIFTKPAPSQVLLKYDAAHSPDDSSLSRVFSGSSSAACLFSAVHSQWHSGQAARAIE